MLRREPKEVPSITSAVSSQSSQVDRKERDYLISMAIRSACFIGFVFVDHPIRWVMGAGAIFLPYIAVVIGNATIRKAGDGPSPFGFTHGELPATPSSTPNSEPAKDVDS